MKQFKSFVRLTCVTALAATAAPAFAADVSFDFAPDRLIPDASASGIADAWNLVTGISGVTDLNARLNISGPFNGDIYSYLTHGSGFTVLLNRVGRDGATPFGYGDQGFNITLDDAAANDVHTYRLQGTPVGALTGSWQPDGRTADPSTVVTGDPRLSNLGSFNGGDVNGLWTLFAADMAPVAVHRLSSWGLDIAAANGGAVDVGNGVRFTSRTDADLGGGRLTVGAGGRADFTSASPVIGSLAGSGQVGLPAATQLTAGGDNSSTTFDGSFAGGGSLAKSGSGTLTLGGAQTLGGVAVNGGALALSAGMTLNAPVTVAAAGTLSGEGTIVGNVIIAGTHSPGASPGLQVVQGNYENSGSYVVELNGTTAGISYDQTEVFGGVTLNNATLAVSIGYSAALLDTFIIIENDGADAIAGTFGGLPEGSVLSVGTYLLQMSYVAGDGNDAGLTVVPEPGTPLLMLLGGLGAWIFLRRMRRS